MATGESNFGAAVSVARDCSAGQYPLDGHLAGIV